MNEAGSSGGNKNHCTVYGQDSACMLLKCKPGTYFSASHSLAQYPWGGEAGLLLEAAA